MFKKQAVILSASAGASCKKTIAPIKDSLVYWGVPSIKTYGIAVQAMSWNTMKLQKKDKIEKNLTKIAIKINKSKKPPQVGLKTKVIFHVMKMMHKKNWDSSPIEKQYWDEMGWLHKSRPWKHK